MFFACWCSCWCSTPCIFKEMMGREEFRLLLILLFSIDLFTENFPFKLIETLIYTIDLFSRR
ncbi:First ORF in transposon ISC1225 [Saccharolobus solfataricus P2]|uniref:First ORF in transposon ISC1225 n=2 Tax=Saccharolobus solfataricus TaxID=2287 RepID=Q97ZP7_SACS2|nr:First ORF in transposon ISC1225 [Saccharolobus solfataricus P2]SAI84395.1 ORF1 in transposon ISC1225 [Saccharolobus solfataricus]